MPRWRECRCPCRIQHRPARRAVARVTFQQAQAHRRGRMLAGAECGFGGDDDCAADRLRLLLPAWSSDTDQPRPDRAAVSFALASRNVATTAAGASPRGLQVRESGRWRLPDCRARDLDQAPPFPGRSTICERPRQIVGSTPRSRSRSQSADLFSPDIHEVRFSIVLLDWSLHMDYTHRFIPSQEAAAAARPSAPAWHGRKRE